MPQLDIITYLPQCTWLFIIYITFYLFLTKYTLPTITKILYTRQYKALQATHTAQSPLQYEQQEKIQTTTGLVSFACVQAKNALQHTMTQSETWTQKTLVHIQQKQLQKLQNTFAQHMKHTHKTLAHTNNALKYTCSPSAQHACHMNKPCNTNKTRFFQKTYLHTLFKRAV